MTWWALTPPSIIGGAKACRVPQQKGIESVGDTPPCGHPHPEELFLSQQEVLDVYKVQNAHTQME
jgi:hypothetical protein